LVHQYFSIDPDTLLDVIERHLPPLRKALAEQESKNA
ncbi:HepT-like ribonuclease domain-containing protein, partial [Candidatus Corynebacterium faecigallinarum]